MKDHCALVGLKKLLNCDELLERFVEVVLFHRVVVPLKIAANQQTEKRNN